MKKLKINFKYCYGIKSLEHIFDFNNKNAIAIYAPNGCMKTSFARTFSDIAEGNYTIDEVNGKNVTTVREVSFENYPQINKENVLVFGTLDNRYKSEKQSLLLVNQRLKREYEDIIKMLDSKKDQIFSHLFKKISVKNISKELCTLFDNSDEYVVIEQIYQSLDDSLDLYSNIPYKIVFNDKVKKLCEDTTFMKSIKVYLEKYNELLEESTFLSENFGLRKASNVYKSLNENSFFDVKNSILLKKDSNVQEIKSSKDLTKLIGDEVESVLKDPSLEKEWQTINKKLNSNAQVKEFSDYISLNKWLLKDLVNIKVFQRKCIVAYFLDYRQMLKEYNDIYQESKKEIGEILIQADAENTLWAEVVNVFNTRFNVPFKLSIENKKESVLGISAHLLKFEFENVQIEEETLLRVLSTGETRAFYMLQILFEIQGRIKEELETIIIADDVADSFDYKNKYAIVEYLNDIGKLDFFKLIILTHNFDFFRTAESRFVGFNNCYIASREKSSIKISSFKGYKNPFLGWKKKKFKGVSVIIASIAFSRNLVEYLTSEENEDYIELTGLLHWKKKTGEYTFRELNEIYKKYYLFDIDVDDLSLNVIDVLFLEADKISQKKELYKLEEKILLSIAIRIRLEKELVKFVGEEFWLSINKGNQTKKLCEEYKRLNEKGELVKIIEKVNIITPENIHVNSFMFEPIVDISGSHLIRLYREVSQTYHL